MDYDFAKLLVDASRDAMRRCRWILSVLSISALAIFGATWNLYFSWLRTVALLPAWASENIVKDLQERLLTGWVDSGFMSVPLLGIKLHVTDAGFIGAIALTTLTLWLFYSVRRQNHLIGKTLRLAQSAPRNIQEYVYYGITASNVFTTVSRNDEPIRSLRFSQDESKLYGARAAYTALFYLPAMTIAWIMVCDILSIVLLHSAFRSGHVAVGLLHLTAEDIVRILLIDITALVMAMACSFIAHYCRRYEAANVEVLREFSNQLYPPAEREQATTRPVASSNLA